MSQTPPTTHGLCDLLGDKYILYMYTIDMTPFCTHHTREVGQCGNLIKREENTKKTWH